MKTTHEDLLKVKEQIKMSFWDPFTERARRTVVLAQEEAQRLGCNYLGSEHLLLGVISEGESQAAKVLENHKVTLTRVRLEVEAIVGRGPGTTQAEMIFTPRAKRIIELAFDAARELQQNYLSTEHLLLGLLKDNEGVASRVITNLGATSLKMREEVLAIINKEQKHEFFKEHRKFKRGDTVEIINVDFFTDCFYQKNQPLPELGWLGKVLGYEQHPSTLQFIPKVNFDNKIILIPEPLLRAFP